MILSSIAMFASALSFQLTCYNYNSEVIYNGALNPYLVSRSSNDYSELDISHSFRLDNLQGVSAEDVKSFRVDFLYSTSNDSGNYQNKCFSYSLTFSEWDEHDRVYILASSDAGYVSGYFGQGNLFVYDCDFAVRDYVSDSLVSYRSAYYDYLYYDNLDSPFDFTGLNSFNEVSPSYFAFSMKFGIVPENIYNQIDGAMSDSDGQYENGYNYGKEVGYEEGIKDGYNEGYSEGKTDGTELGRIQGYNEGYMAGAQSTGNPSFMGLFTSIADTPILMIRKLFGFEIFGTSALAVVFSFLTAIIIIKILKKVLK